MPDGDVQTSRPYCPTCEPEHDPSDRYSHPVYCTPHAPDTSGQADHVVRVETFLNGNADVDGESNRRWCALIHRNRDKEVRR